MRMFPLWSVYNGQCSCSLPDCRNAGKHPKVSQWQDGINGYVPTFGEGYGIVTGEASGIFVIDLDGDEAVEAFDKLGPCPKTFSVRSGREALGIHRYFKYPAGETIKNDKGRKLGLHIDVRGEGGFIVGPGSPHASGNVYTVLEKTPPVDAPEWLLAKLRLDLSERREASVLAPKAIVMESDLGQERVALAVRYLSEEADPTGPRGQGNDESGKAWLVANQLVRTLELPVDVCADLWEAHYSPRSSDPWSRREIIHKLEDARDRGTRMPGTAPAGWEERMKAAAQKPHRPVVVARRRRDPGHAYSFQPGDRPNGDKQELSFGQAIAELTSHKDWDGVCQYDDFRRRVVMVDPPLRLDAEDPATGLTEEDGYAIAAWFEVNSMYIISGDRVYRAAVQAARRNRVHPVKEYLDSCGEKVTGILDTLATRVLGAKDPIENEFLKKTLVAAVRRIRHPGEQMDTVLVLCGKQGARKTTFVRELFGPEFTRSQMPDLASKDASQALNGFWAIELAELARVLQSPHSVVREFLTRTFDDYRPPYGRTDQRFPRQCVLIGTVNEDDFLADPEGNRRYLPIAVHGDIDIDFLRAHRDEIWSEACALETAGYAHFYDTKGEERAESARRQYLQEDPWQEAVEDYVKGRTEVQLADVYKDVISKGDLDLNKFDRKVQMRLADTLKRLGCFPKRSAGKRIWSVAEGLSKAAPSPEEITRRTRMARVLGREKTLS